MSQESRGNVFCIRHGGPISECTDGCEIKQNAGRAAQVNPKNVWAHVSTLPMTNDEAVARAQALQQADLARIARVRAEQEALLRAAKRKVTEDDPEKPEDSDE